jgi:glycosyltransferase involved in cell wall biosynthesis
MQLSGIKRGVAVVTYNRVKNLGGILDAIKDTVPQGTKLVVADDGSTDGTVDLVSHHSDYVLLRGANKGVAHNKNRALFALQDCDMIALIEDDLTPVQDNWFLMYEKAVLYSGIHHFCRVQDNLLEEVVPSFETDMQAQGMTPIYGPSPRGDFTFVTKKVGGFNPAFIGAGYAHGEWSNRVYNANLIPHPRKWVDIRNENGDPFQQVGDREGGRWAKPKHEIQEQIAKNRATQKSLKNQNYIFHPIVLE